MKVRILKNANIGGQHLIQGSTPDLSEADAKSLLNKDRVGGPLAEKVDVAAEEKAAKAAEAKAKKEAAAKAKADKAAEEKAAK